MFEILANHSIIIHSSGFLCSKLLDENKRIGGKRTGAFLAGRGGGEGGFTNVFFSMLPKRN